MVRKCGLCGLEGHNSRKCHNLDADKEERERQKNLVVPEVIHITISSNFLCGQERIEWPLRCLDDGFASQLPICPDCEFLNSQLNKS